MESKNNLYPVVKWAGGKTQLLDAISSRLPKSFHHYYEPFSGGAAVLLHIQPEYAHINDINPYLVNVYTQIQRHVKDVIGYLRILNMKECTSELYYERRSRFNEMLLNGQQDAESAAMFIWINKHCFNGLYRVNRSGAFNVPYNQGHWCFDSRNEQNLRAVSKYLKKADITNMDFEAACTFVQPDDFIYFDSPYLPEQCKDDVFVSYNSDGFSSADHYRLFKLFQHLDQMGVKLMLSNNDSDAVRSWYRHYRIEAVDARRSINSNSSDRKGKEVIITNY